MASTDTTLNLPPSPVLLEMKEEQYGTSQVTVDSRDSSGSDDCASLFVPDSQGAVESGDSSGSGDCASFENQCSSQLVPSRSYSKKRVKESYADNSTERTSNHQYTFGTGESNTGSTGNAVGSGSDGAMPTPQRITPRGRKQSLTQNNSKKHICSNCRRGFKRSEHLKRHVRSRHTDEKPFGCETCGWRFTRKDNMMQHARKHKVGTTVTEVLEDDELVPTEKDEDFKDDNNIDQLGAILLKAAQAAVASSH